MNTHLIWQKSSYSASGSCVEVAGDAAGTVLVRDSKDPEGPRLAFTAGEWARFTATVRNGKFPAR